jgi:hypothetical protein
LERAEELVYQALEPAESNLDKADINNIRIIHYQNKARYEEAIQIGLETLELLVSLYPIHQAKLIYYPLPKKQKKTWVLGKLQTCSMNP